MNPFFSNLRLFFGRLSAGQKIALAVVLIGGIVTLSGVASWAGRPDYALLFGRLEPSDASKVVESLRSQGVKYELRQNGTAIFVPRDDVYELRLRFAGEGLVSEGPTGYELFDRGTLGMTDFMQKLNMKRALEGELARTIASVRQIDMARVHLVIPERSPFREAQSRPSASVVIQLSGASALGAEQIQGITALVGGAVEGLSESDVTVLDTRGNLLSNPEVNNPQMAVGTVQLRMQQTVEAHLTDKGQSMLDRVLGPGNAIVRVSASLDFDRSVSERAYLDPESATVISEEELEETNIGGTGNASSAVRNYDVNRTTERLEKSVGDVRYMTVSVILNQRLRPGEGAEAPVPHAYSDGELTQIEALVKNAVGFNADRGDRIAVTQTRFDTSFDQQLAAEIDNHRNTERTALYLRYGLMLLALLVAAWLLRSASRHINLVEFSGPLQMLSAAGGSGVLSGHEHARALDQHHEYQDEDQDLGVDDVYMSKLTPEARRRLKAKHLMFEEIKNQVMTEPADTAETIKSWIITDMKTSA